MKASINAGELEGEMTDEEMVKCPKCNGNPRRWLSHDECQQMCVPLGSYEDCTNCEDGYVEEGEEHD